MTDVTCTDSAQTGGDASSGSLTATASTEGSVTFNVKPGDDVRCDVTNTQDAQISIKKITDPASDTTTTFGFTKGSGFANTSAFADSPLVGGQTSTKFSVQPAAIRDSYTVTEDLKAGWRMTDVTCTDSAQTGGDASSGSLTPTASTEGSVTFNVKPGDDVRCDVTNTQDAQISIKKITIPASDQPTTSTLTPCTTLANSSAFADSPLVGGQTST